MTRRTAAVLLAAPVLSTPLVWGPVLAAAPAVAAVRDASVRAADVRTAADGKRPSDKKTGKGRKAEEAPTPLELSLRGISPAAPRAVNTLRVRGLVRNAGSAPVDAVTVRLRLSPRPLANRTEVAEVADGRPDVRDLQPVPGSDSLVLDRALAPGAQAPFTLAVRVKDLHLPGNGVYVLAVEAGSAVAASTEATTTVTTFLPYLPKKKEYSPTQVSWLWPLAEEPGRDTRGAFTDDALAAAIAPGGRLADLFEAPGTLPVTWMVDPELLESVAALAGEHTVREGRRVTTVGGDPNAALWLTALKARLAGKPVAALPYADPDVAGLAQHASADRIEVAVKRSQAATASIFGRMADTALAWPPEGLADAATLTALRRAGATAAVLASTTVRPSAELTYTPTGRATVGTDAGQMQVLLADDGLAQALAGDLAAPGAGALARQRFLADSAMLTLERPNAPRTVLVAPPRRWSPPAGWARTFLAAAAQAPWLATVDLASMSRTVESPELAGAELAYPDDVHELGADFVARIRAAGDAADSVSAVLAQPGALGAAYQAAALRAASSVWRDDRKRGRLFVDAVNAALRADANKVRVSGRTLVNLSSNHGTVPFTVSNGLAQAVRVRLVLTPRVGSRLRITAPELITIRPGRNKTVGVEARSSANGLTRVAVSLESVSGLPLGSPIELRVNTTSYGSLGLVVVGGAVGVLFVAAGVRNVRRIRGARGTAQGSRRAAAPGPDPQDQPPGLAVDETVQA